MYVANRFSLDLCVFFKTSDLLKIRSCINSNGVLLTE